MFCRSFILERSHEIQQATSDLLYVKSIFLTNYLNTSNIISKLKQSEVISIINIYIRVQSRCTEIATNLHVES